MHRSKDQANQRPSENGGKHVAAIYPWMVVLSVRDDVVVDGLNVFQRAMLPRLRARPEPGRGSGTGHWRWP